MELTGEDLNFFSEFERIVRVMPRDYYLSDSLLVFLVDLKYLGKAIGKKGSNIPKLRSVFRKNVVILGDSPDPEIFLGSMFNNVKIFSIEVLDVMNEKNIIFTTQLCYDHYFLPYIARHLHAQLIQRATTRFHSASKLQHLHYRLH